MKRHPLVILFTITLLAQSAGLHQVYVLPMGGGLDQYLADWLTREKVMQVVTDPKAADLVMTDRLGEAFEQRLAQILPPPEKPVKKGDKSDDKSDEKAAKSIETGGAPPVHSAFRSSSARGTLFLVDLKTRQVVWSDHEKPPTPSDANLNREAERVAKKLHETFAK
ncbi:MAG TPA: hypothetical protein VG273_22000 [Bryobacteraceae bacterium]|jgi:hypothetical protein|nr:hypothetical protein [Bryobacteraceae bacterium]